MARGGKKRPSECSGAKVQGHKRPRKRARAATTCALSSSSTGQTGDDNVNQNNTAKTSLGSGNMTSKFDQSRSQQDEDEVKTIQQLPVRIIEKVDVTKLSCNWFGAIVITITW
jgi:hypothetical protein